MFHIVTDSYPKRSHPLKSTARYDRHTNNLSEYDQNRFYTLDTGNDPYQFLKDCDENKYLSNL